MASFFKPSVVVSQSKAIVPWTVIQGAFQQDQGENEY